MIQFRYLDIELHVVLIEFRQLKLQQLVILILKVVHLRLKLINKIIYPL